MKWKNNDRWYESLSKVIRDGKTVFFSSLLTLFYDYKSISTRNRNSSLKLKK